MNGTIHRMYRHLVQLVPGIAFIAACLIGVEVIVHLNLVNAAILPAPSQVFKALGKLLYSGDVFAPLGYTTGLLLGGWLLACFAGLGIGLAMGLSQRIYNLLEVVVELIRPIPKPALVPPLMLLLGLGPSMEIAIVVLGAFFPILISTTQAVRGVDIVRINVARSFRVSQWHLISKVVLPESLPMILSGMKVSLSLAIVLAVLAEMLTGSGGLGAVIVELQTAFKAREMYAWVFIVAILGFGLIYVFERLEERLNFWQRENGAG